MARSKYLPQLAVGIKEKYGTTLLNVDGKAQWATTAYAQINIPVFHWGEMRQNVRLSRTQEWTKELERSIKGIHGRIRKKPAQGPGK